MESHCPHCGTTLSADLPFGLCPKCLLTNRQSSRLEAGAPPRAIGDYELIEELARGGMGVVYKARQLSLNRIVAVKMILKGEFASPQEIQRFQAEAEAAAALEHPNILPVYEVGQDANWHFFTMRLIEGGSLEHALKRAALTHHDAAKLIATVARAVHHAHQHGILHRDLKPANILLDNSGEPHVADFGLAKQLEKDNEPRPQGSGTIRSATRSGAIMGTPGYMSPEQAAGNTKRVTTAADVYSLGAILYETLAGRPPFEGDSALDVIKKVVEQEPLRPRRINPSISRELEAICMKCLEKNPARRYSSAEALAQDLTRFLNGESVAADSTNVLRRLGRMLERSQHDAEFHKWGTMLICFGAIILAGHAATFMLIRTHQRESTLWLSRGIQLALETFCFWRLKPRSSLPSTSVERQLWSIWIGFLIAYAANVLACRALVLHALVERGGAGPEYWSDLILYPITSILAGLAFFVMGSNYWGRCYQFAIAFFVLAVAMPLKLDWAPLEFGLLACAVLVTFGIHLRRLASS
ncbi:MAG TPA: serine/threonine-protein kinase [Planctomycetota bacterium]|nr:serine/threonine-protein kinase [Planctomycetota bacterium]